MKAIGIATSTSLLASIAVVVLLTLWLPLPFIAALNVGLAGGWVAFIVALCCFYSWVEDHKWD